MNIVFFGTGDFGVPSLESLKRSHSLAAVISTPDKPKGRQLRSQPSVTKAWAIANDIPTFDYDRQDPSGVLGPLKEMRPDLFVVISFGAILPGDLLTVPRLYSLNVHASLLPKYRGAAPMQYALLNGDRETGVTVMRMIERLDAGDILFQKKTPIGTEEDVLQLEKRLSALGSEALREGLDRIERGVAEFTVQDERKAGYTRKIAKNDGRMDWRLPAERLRDRTRAFLGWPGSYFFFQGKRIVVAKTRALPRNAEAPPGVVLPASGNDGLVVSTGGQSCLVLERLQLEGKKMLPWNEFSKGFKLRPGDILE